jgi:hypothetical protein
MRKTRLFDLRHASHSESVWEYAKLSFNTDKLKNSDVSCFPVSHTPQVGSFETTAFNSKKRYCT